MFIEHSSSLKYLSKHEAIVALVLRGNTPMFFSLVQEKPTLSDLNLAWGGGGRKVFVFSALLTASHVLSVARPGPCSGFF